LGRTVSIAVMARSVARELGYYVRLLALVWLVGEFLIIPLPVQGYNKFF
jgi:hypothetical protein